MSKYIEKLETVEAVQFVQGDKPFKPLDKFAGLVVSVSDEGPSISINGKVGRLGDYLVTHADGSRSIINKTLFAAQFEEVKE